jgi:hypothetical protein
MTIATKPLKLFNLDLHISVIEDIKDICQRLFGNQVEITNWSISQHNWVFDKPTPPIEAITAANWKTFSHQHIQSFHKAYDDWLSTFDGFVVTHTPVFAMLFEKYNKPILIVNTCRFDQPFCWFKNPAMEEALTKTLRRLTQSGQATLLSNNYADQWYLQRKTSIPSKVLSSLCLYTKALYVPTKDTFVYYGDKTLKPNVKALVDKPPKGYSWQDLFSYRGIVHSPYEMSTMSIFEQYWAGVPLWFPTKEFYKNCICEAKMEFASPYDLGEDDPISEPELDQWLPLADFYRLPYINYYSSYEDLEQQLATYKDINCEERFAFLEHTINHTLSHWYMVFTALFPALSKANTPSQE